jgi:hypothetical protein
VTDTFDTDTLENQFERLATRRGWTPEQRAQFSADQQTMRAVVDHEHGWDVAERVFGAPIDQNGEPTRQERTLINVCVDRQINGAIYGAGFSEPKHDRMRHTDEITLTSLENALGAMEQQVRATGDGHLRLAALRQIVAERRREEAHEAMSAEEAYKALLEGA